MRTTFKGGRIVSGTGTRRADLVVEDEKVVEVGRGAGRASDRTVDVSGCLLFPGFLDAHTHLDLEVSGTVTADGFPSGSRAALRGGTTTILDFAAPDKGEGLRHGLARWHQKADGRTFCDYGFHMTIDDWDDRIREELPAMFAAGISSFKMYFTYPAMMLSDGEIYQALKALGRYGGICGFHCENASVIDAMIGERLAAGERSPASHPLTRPPILEAEAVARLMRIAQAAEQPVIVVHLTSEDALEEVRRARARGQTVYVETCPQYLLLDESVYFQEEFSDAARYVCAPPLRRKQHQEILWRALRRGEIQTVSTDHCSFTLEQKDRGRDDLTKIPGGLPGVETRGELIWTYGVTRHRIDAGRMCQVLCEAPAKLYGLYPRKGHLSPGADADIVVYDPKADHTIRAEDQISKAGYTPYEDFPISGGIRQVWLRGSLRVEEGKILDDRPAGKYLARGKCAL